MLADAAQQRLVWHTKVLLLRVGIIVLLVLCAGLALSAPPQVVDPASISAMIIVKAIEVPVGLIASKLTGGLVTDFLLHTVLNDSTTCYEEFTCQKGCRDGHVAVERGTRGYDACWKRCCPTQISQSGCYKSDKWGLECYTGYAAVEDGRFGRTCCPEQRSRCFKSNRCFKGCPENFTSVEEGRFHPCDDLCCPSEVCFVGTACWRTCPANYTRIPINRSTLSAGEKTGLALADPFSCIDVCCPDMHVAAEPNLRRNVDTFVSLRTSEIVADKAASLATQAVHESVQAAATSIVESAVETLGAVG